MVVDPTSAVRPARVKILPLIYKLAGVSRPLPAPGGEYPGYPLVVSAGVTLLWFFGALPLLIALCWWWCRRAPSRRSLSRA